MPVRIRSADTASDSAVPRKPGASGGSALSRMLDIFDLFSPSTLIVRAEDVAAHLQTGRSTCYRYLQELSDRGFLVPQGKGRYGLGPRVIELERLLQSSDPLLNAGKQVMATLSDLCDNRTLLMSALYKDKVLCTHQVGSGQIRYGDQLMSIHRGRGSAFPLFQGAGSLAILAHLAPHQIRALYLAKQKEIAAAGLAQEWVGFRRLLTGIRKQGYARTVGKINDRVLALGVPVIGHEGAVIASLLLLMANSPEEYAQEARLVERLKVAASQVSEQEYASRQASGAD